MHRVRFEPIDVEDIEDFQELSKQLRCIINKLYKKDHDEIMPSIRKVYPIDDQGFPIDPATNID